MQAGIKKPLIGFTGVISLGMAWSTDSQPQQVDVFIQDYARSVEAAGGLPVGLPLVSGEGVIDDIVDRLDGIIIAGGMDVHPRMYGEEPLPGIGDMDYELDLMNRQALLSAINSGKPVLGICRGHQLICAALGGSLHQDIPTQIDDCLDHVQKTATYTPCHQVKIEPGSLLEKIVGEQNLWVNSHHHQAVKDLPKDFVAGAFSSDGIVEAMEHPGHDFLLSVQWHPESTAMAGDDKSQRLFKALVSAAGGA